jgi:hypothetical protein
MPAPFKAGYGSSLDDEFVEVNAGTSAIFESRSKGSKTYRKDKKAYCFFHD